MDLATSYREHIAKLSAQYDMALQACGFDAVLLHSGCPTIIRAQDDQYWPLRPLPHFQHWLPLCEADCAVLYRPGTSPVLYRPPMDDFWEGQAPSVGDHFLPSFEVVEAAPELDAATAGRVALIADDPAWAASETLVRADAVLELRGHLDAIRTRKTAYEQHCIAVASRTAAVGHQRVAAMFDSDDQADASELALHLAYLGATGQDDSWTPYKNIVATGRHAATLHHVHYGTGPTLGDTSLLLDAGATCLGYQSDVTRTTVRGQGTDAHAFGELIDAIDRMQRGLCDEIRAGDSYEDLHNLSHQRLAGVLRDAGIARADVETLVDTGVTRAFLPHGIGHSLGLQTHDVGCKLRDPGDNNPFLRNTSTIAVDQVFTIEPGCYFIDGLLEPLRASPHAALVDWTRVEQFAPFGGIRVEDNIVVTEDGHRNLTREAFADLE